MEQIRVQCDRKNIQLYAINNGATVARYTLAGGAGLGKVQQRYLENLDILQNHHQMELALPYRSVQTKVRP